MSSWQQSDVTSWYVLVLVNYWNNSSPFWDSQVYLWNDTDITWDAISGVDGATDDDWWLPTTVIWHDFMGREFSSTNGATWQTANTDTQWNESSQPAWHAKNQDTFYTQDIPSWKQNNDTSFYTED